MLAYLLRRVGYLAFVVWGVGFAAFFISRVVPADPAAAALGANAREEQIEAYREQFGLNDPVPVQYVNYMRDLFRGDLGDSLRTRRPIIEDLRDYFPATLELTLAAMLIAALGITTHPDGSEEMAVLAPASQPADALILQSEPAPKAEIMRPA